MANNGLDALEWFHVFYVNNATDEEKSELYDRGVYLVPPPMARSALWEKQDWIKFIDSHGLWMTYEAKCLAMHNRNQGIIEFYTD